MNCGKCGRPVRSERTLRSPAGRHGYGPRCWRMVRAAARVLLRSADLRAVKAGFTLLDGYAPARVGRNPTVRRTVGWNGVRTYLTHPNACNCEAGLHSLKFADRLCWHRIMIQILAA